MMTIVEMAICVTAITALSGEANNKYGRDTHVAIATNICAAANKTEIDPRILAAYVLTENGKFDPLLDKPASRGVDKGLFHSNSFYNGHRPNFQWVNHPFYGAEIASNIIKENLVKFGSSWQAVAAYWSPVQAQKKTPEALAYYQRWRSNFSKVQRTFDKASNDVVALQGTQ